MTQAGAPSTKSRRLLWALFAWLGIPLSFAVFVPLVLFLLPLNDGALLIAAIVFTAIGTFALVKGQRPARTWIIVIYPLPMVFILMLVGVAVVLLAVARGCC